MTQIPLFLKRAICRLWSDEQGAALTEAAISGTVMILLLLYTLELGQAANIAMETSNAARAAVAYGSQNSITATDTLGMQQAARLEAPGLAASNVTLSISATPACSCSSPDTTVTPFSCFDASTASCPSPSFVEQSLFVTVTAVYKPLGLPTTFTLTGHATQKRLND